MADKVDMTPAVNEVINTGIKNDVVNSKKLKIKWHTVEELYERCRTTLRNSTASHIKLSFKSLRHYDEENDSIKKFNDDFIVGLFTIDGPIACHYKMEFYEEFAHVPLYDHAPMYDGYTEREWNRRYNKFTNMILEGKTDDEIIEMINNNESLHESQKPKYLKR